MFEVTIKVKGDGQTLTDKHLVYDEVTLSFDDPILKELVADMQKRFKATGGEVEDVSLTIKMEWQ